MSDEIQLSQQNQIIDNNEILKLITDVVSQSNSDREAALALFEKLSTKEFSKLHEVTMKAEAVLRSLELAGRATDRINYLLSTIQKFNTDKNQKDIANKILDSNEANNILDLLNQLNIGPERILNPMKTEIKEDIQVDGVIEENDGDKNE